MKKRLLCLLVVLCLVAALFTGCNSGGGTASESPSKEAASESADSASPSANEGDPVDANAKSDLVFGYSVYWMSEFTTLMTAGMEKKADELGVTLQFVDADKDPNAQIGQVENFIAQKVDAIIVAAVDVEAIKPAVDAAKEANIPFIAVNMFIESDNLTAYSGPDDVQAGELAMQYVADKMGGEGGIIVLEGADGYSATTDRHDGIHNVLDKTPGIELLAEKTANWDRAEATSMMENYIQNFGDKIKGVVAHNDEMALGALQALESNGMLDSVYVSAIDAIKDACVSINEGKMDATVFQDAELEGGLAVELAYKIVKGETVEKDNRINMILVTKDNVAEYLAMYE